MVLPGRPRHNSSAPKTKTKTKMLPYWLSFVITSCMGVYPAFIPDEDAKGILYMINLIGSVLMLFFTGIPSDEIGGFTSKLRRLGSTVIPYLVTAVGTSAIVRGDTRTMGWCLVLYGILLGLQGFFHGYASTMNTIDREVQAILMRQRAVARVEVNQNLSQVAVELSEVEKPESEDWECPICKEPATTEGGLCKRRCGHVYHTACALEAAEHDPRCPLCRRLDSDPVEEVTDSDSIV